MKTILGTESQTDEQLVEWSLTGDREAFGRIVERYQSLVCSITYGATGSLSLSEDIAQETFVTAWRKLEGLNDAAKLRTWLCGIARNLTKNSLRRGQREPVLTAESLESIHEQTSPEPSPAAQAVSREEEAILWRALERIPDTYREPLILFYREQKSVERVAQELELSEDAVKQRLSRGRKLLTDEVAAFVEGTLERTNPGKVFTLGVLAALPAMTISAKAATIGAAAAKGSATAKAAGAMGLFGAILSPLLVIFGNYSSYRMSMDEARTDEERGHIKSVFRNSLFIALAISAVLALPLFYACRNQHDSTTFWGLMFSQIVVVYFLTIFAFFFASLPRRRRYLAETLAKECGGNFPPAAYEYRSRLSLFGLPLVHVRIGDRFDVLRGPVKAWIAIGSSHAVGVIFASGGIAVAPLSFGGIAIGILPFGAMAVGIFSLGAISFGVWCYGALAVGWQVFCGSGIAWNAAMGGFVIAHDFANGAVGHAAQINTELAKQFFQQSLFFRCAKTVSDHGLLLMFVWVIPVTLMSRVVARARRRRESVAR